MTTRRSEEKGTRQSLARLSQGGTPQHFGLCQFGRRVAHCDRLVLLCPFMASSGFETPLTRHNWVISTTCLAKSMSLSTMSRARRHETIPATLSSSRAIESVPGKKKGLWRRLSAEPRWPDDRSGAPPRADDRAALRIKNGSAQGSKYPTVTRAR